MIWARMLAYITGTVDQELLLRNEYLAAENRILRAQIKGRLLLSHAEKATLAEIAHRLGRKALDELAAIARPETLLAGTENSSLTSLTDRSIANHGVVPESTKKLSGGWCEWRRRIPGGAMTGSWAPWPTWVFSCRIKRWPIFSAGMIFRRFPGGSRPPVGKILSVLTWRYWQQPTFSRWKC